MKACLNVGGAVFSRSSRRWQVMFLANWYTSVPSIRRRQRWMRHSHPKTGLLEKILLCSQSQEPSPRQNLHGKHIESGGAAIRRGKIGFALNSGTASFSIITESPMRTLAFRSRPSEAVERVSSTPLKACSRNSMYLAAPFTVRRVVRYENLRVDSWRLSTWPYRIELSDHW